jgi:4-hydroxybenzoate polyprenyltransferase
VNKLFVHCESTVTAVSPPSSASWRDYLQLVRLPNVFTAMADVLMGYLVTHDPAPLPTLRLPADFWAVLAASSSLYWAGMVLNDVNDFEIDRVQRPQRPLPSGRISLKAARRLGYGLLIVGVVLAAFAGLFSNQYRSPIVAMLLAIAIVLYDGPLKRSPLAPLLMGACRLLNVLLGMSAAGSDWQAMHYVIAAGLGLYIVGVTWFARREAGESSRPQLGLATLVMLAGIALLASYPQWVDPSLAAVSWPRFAAPTRWPLVWTVVGLMIAWRCAWAVADPSPQRVQYAVRNCIFSLIVLDGLVTFGVRGLWWAVAVLLLLLPTMYLGRWIYST